MSGNLCRFCLGKEILKPLFEHYRHLKKYVIVLKQTTGLDININDGFPQFVCEECSITINSLLDFQKQCLKSEIELNKLGFVKNEYKHIKKKTKKINKTNNELIDISLECKNEDFEEIFKDSIDNYEPPDLHVSVEFDRLSQKEEDTEQIAQYGELNCVTNDVYIKPKINKEEQISNEFYGLSPNEGQHVEFNFETNDEDIKPKTLIEIEPIIRNKKEKKLNRKEKRELYLSLIDGNFDPKGPIRCKVCKKTVSRWTSFITHCKLHLGFNYVCEFCGKSFISITQLNRHCRSHHGMKRELQCSQCDYLALDNTQLNLHIRSVHTGERPYVCDFCEASYFSRKCLLQHIEYHLSHKSVQCDKCPKQFKSRRHLSKHIYITHTSKEFTYKCPICNQMYRNFKYIGVHLKKLHGVTKKDIHERIHTGERPYCCKVCGATFRKLSGYNQHVPIHLSKKTIKCEICPMMFKSLPRMREHRDRKHRSRKYIYKCGICNNIFSQRQNVMQHLKKQHNYADSEEQKPIERLLKTGL